MNSMIENLVIDMRALGVKSLAIELDGAPLGGDRPTMLPDELQQTVEPEFRGDPNQCAEVGCGEPNGGILGGKMKQFCRKHAFARGGIK